MVLDENKIVDIQDTLEAFVENIHITIPSNVQEDITYLISKLHSLSEQLSNLLDNSY